MNENAKTNVNAKIRIIPEKQKLIYIAVFAGAVLAYVLSLLQLKLAFSGSLENIMKAFTYLFRMIRMNFQDIGDVSYAAFQSISVAILATIISAALAFMISFFAASNVSFKGLAMAIKGLATAIRAVPTLIWALIFVAFLGFGPFAGVLGLVFHSFAYLTKAFSQSIEEVNGGCLEAMRATGASWLQIMTRGVVPLIKTSVISWTALRFEINIGQSSILGMVGAGGIGYELTLNVRQFNFEKAGFVLLVIFLMSFSVEMLFNKLKLNVDNRRLKEK